MEFVSVPDGELHRGGESSRVLCGGDQQLVDVGLAQVLEIQLLKG